MATRRELAVASFDRYLQRQHCALWGRAYNPTDNDSRRAAAEWFIGELLAWAGAEESEKRDGKRSK